MNFLLQANRNSLRTSREYVKLRILFHESDRAISTLCEISNRTVRKHVENIYRKPGVETRTSAMHRGLEYI